MISSRICALEFQGNPKTTILSCYSPTNVSPQSEVESFYNDLNRFIDTVPPHNFLIICGDLNARLGKDHFPFAVVDSTNRNGQSLLSFMTDNELFSCATKFQKRPTKKITFLPLRTEIDHILVRKKWESSVKDTGSFSNPDINSDHKMLSSKIQLCFRCTPTTAVKRPPKRQWSLLLEEKHQKLRAEFESTFHNRYAALATVQEDPETDTYSALAQAALETGESILPPTPRQNRRIPWNDADIQALREKKRLARNKSDKQKLSHQLSDLYAGKVTKYIDEQSKTVEAAHPAAEYRVAWKAVKEISGNRKPSPPRIIGGSPQERKERWQIHFQTLLNVHRPNQDPSQAEFNPTPASDLLPISTDPISPEEFDSAFQKLKYKAPGNDEIPAEFFKSGIASAQLLNIMNLAFETGTAPREWTKSVIIPIPKQGGLTDPAKFRGISLTSLAAKTYNRIPIDRVKPHVDPLLRKNQNGFRQGRVSVD
ncbi:uncharacterized protein LOC141892781 [Acropora palmata]|uniref:uncharacterized protein LOC141892781 n=1 Tax=Acropora palmata TaxID=6131 RepID=UPI003DA105A1